MCIFNNQGQFVNVYLTEDLFFFSLPKNKVVLRGLFIGVTVCLYPNHITGGTSNGSRFYSAAEPPPKDSSYLLRFSFFITSGMSHSSNHWSRRPSPSTDVGMRICNIAAKRQIHPLTLCRRITPKHSRVTTVPTVDYTVSYHVKILLRILTVRWLEARDFKHFKTSVAHARNWTFCHCVTSWHTDIRW